MLSDHSPHADDILAMASPLFSILPLADCSIHRLEMKSNDKDDKSEFHASNELAESSEDTSGFFESSSTLNNEKLYMAVAPDQGKAFANSRLRSAKLKMQQVCNVVNEGCSRRRRRRL